LLKLDNTAPFVSWLTRAKQYQQMPELLQALQIQVVQDSNKSER